MSKRTVSRPELFDDELVKCLLDKDAEGAASLFEEHAVLVAPAGQVFQDLEEIKQACNFIVNMASEATTKPKRLLQNGDVALLHTEWTLKGTLPSGDAYAGDGTSAIVLRQQADATWLAAVLNRPGGEKIPVES